jgi:hypothetical protein
MPTSTRRSSAARPDEFQKGQLTTDGDVDPLDILTLPPPDETPSDRAARERHEQEAMQRSRSIDAELKAAKASMKRYKKAVKILVLGQSLSGQYAPIFYDNLWLK